ncbi:MAG: hypothetical protein WDA07_06200 [Leucobacter sp.]
MSFRDVCAQRAPEMLDWLQDMREEFGEVRLLHARIGDREWGRPLPPAVEVIPTRELYGRDEQPTAVKKTAKRRKR